MEDVEAINASLANHWNVTAGAHACKLAEKKKEPDCSNGGLVLVAKPFFEKGAAAMMPQCDGPLLIYNVLGASACLLTGPLSHEPACDGKPVSIARLIRYSFPVKWAGAGAVELLELRGLCPTACW